MEYTMRKVLFLFFAASLIFIFTLFVPQAFSSELDEINRKLTELQAALSASRKATAPLESQLNNLQKQLTEIENQVALVERDLTEKKKFIDQGYEELEENKIIFNKTVRDFYIKSYFLSPLLIFISQADAAEITRFIIYQKRDADRDKNTITQIALKIVSLEERKMRLEEEENKLSAIKTRLASEKSEVEKVVRGARAYQAELSGKIAELTAQQREILGQRLGALNLPRTLGSGTLICTNDRDPRYNPGFSPRFAFFTFGIPHRVGMNQYGAWGRAKSGQSHEQILHAYFQNFEFQAGRENENVVVSGTNEFGQTFNNETMNIEGYLRHLHEMPTSWTDNDSAALKAQAIAARSYALRVYSERLADSDPNNNFLRPSQADQVIKRELNSQTWINAVEATRGVVMVNGGQPIKAWYASTSGGYTFPSHEVWGGSTPWTKNLRDTEGDVSSFSDIISKSYDRDSRCLYAAHGWRNEYAKSAWLKPAEVGDIINVILLARSDSSLGCFLYQTDKPPPAANPRKGCPQTGNWSADRVRQELSSRGITPFNNVSDVSVSADFSSGRTTSVNVSGDGGAMSFSGQEFRDWFNLRAPANIQIVGPLYNIERQ
jgi:peptidoglycan hydrolase-like amidase